MDFVDVQKNASMATVVLSRGKVNALNEGVIEEIRSAFSELENDLETRAVILTGQGKFFSFGFDIPHFISYSKQEFTNFLKEFTGLYAYLFTYPKPIVAALNGHTIAGGCMLALACDNRVMASGKAKISFNEIGFGSSLFAGSVEMLRFLVGNKNATEILYSGAMYSAEEARDLGLLDDVVADSELIERATRIALDLAQKSPQAFASVKSLLRNPTAADMQRKEEESIKEFVEIWYSESTRANLRNIKIY